MEGPMMITQPWHGTARADARPGVVRRICDGVAAGAALVLTWRGRQRQRDLLNAPDDRMVRDIGLAADTRAREMTKPFWRA